jgi:hypothetical protein
MVENYIPVPDLLPLDVSELPPILHAEESSQKIKRQYPTKKRETYTERYDKSVFEKLRQMNEDMELQDDYKKWKNGINYKTNRKIRIDGKIHQELKHKFMIYSCGGVLFDTLNSINAVEYLQETDRENAIIKEYNKLVDSIIEKIQKLERWNDFIEFEGKFYGIPSEIVNNIHRENDCLGEMVFTGKETTYSSNNRPFYDDTVTTYSIYKCSKCSYENKELENIICDSHYVSQLELCY